jgi:hypothetical protein
LRKCLAPGAGWPDHAMQCPAGRGPPRPTRSPPPAPCPMTP